jgi:hypothetical protein
VATHRNSREARRRNSQGVFRLNSQVAIRLSRRVATGLRVPHNVLLPHSLLLAGTHLSSQAGSARSRRALALPVLQVYHPKRAR